MLTSYKLVTILRQHVTFVQKQLAVRALSIFARTSEIMKLIIGRNLGLRS